jgi:hypothetical protein
MNRTNRPALVIQARAAERSYRGCTGVAHPGTRRAARTPPFLLVVAIAGAVASAACGADDEGTAAGSGGAVGVGGGAAGGAGGAGASAAGGGAPPAPKQVFIDFDELADYTEVSTQYAPDVTFSTSAGEPLLARSFGDLCMTSAPNQLCAGQPGVFDAPTILDFGGLASSILLRTGCVQMGGQFATATLSGDGGPIATVALMSAGYQTDLDLSSYSGVTRLELGEILDDAGVCWDDISFLLSPG